MTRTQRARSERAGPRVRHAEVIDAAVELFHSRGYASSSIQAIADEMGLLKGSMYYYFKNKEDLLFQILEAVHDDLGEILAGVRAEEALPPLDRLYTYVRRQAEYSANNVKKIAIYYRDSEHLSPHHRDAIYARRREHERFVTQLITEAQERNEIPVDEDPHLLANLVFGSFIWTYRWYDPERYSEPSSFAAACARFTTRALRSYGWTTADIENLAGNK